MSTTIAALTSGNSPAAVSIIRISGKNCKSVLKRAMNIENPQARKMTRAKYISAKGEIIDDVLFAYFQAPASYTGEDCLEIFTHGNPFIVQNILRDLFANECDPAQAGEFTRRAFINDKMDLSQAEAVSLIIGARNKRALQAAQKQLDGELGKRINAFSSRLVDACALVEAYIDFPEDDLPQEDKDKLLHICKNLAKDTRNLAATSKYSALIHNGINTVIAGAPNAGKSSLLNVLTASERAIVSPLAGTTRDFICEKIVLGDFNLNLIDTAGLRNSENLIENMGVEIALKKIKDADIRLLIIDTVENPNDFEISPEVKADMSQQNTIVVLNKCDMPNSNSKEFENKFSGYTSIKISCKTEDGVQELKNALIEFIKKYQIQASADDILVSARHAQSLENAADALDCAAEKIEENAAAELAASDLRSALNSIGEIVGKTDNEAILDKIFSSFCIGK